MTVGTGTNVLVITATSPTGGTAQTTRTVVNDVVGGTLLLDATDPSGDDNGPGNYAYPTAPAFHPGAYDLQDFQVYDTGSTVTFRVQTARPDRRPSAARSAPSWSTCTCTSPVRRRPRPRRRSHGATTRSTPAWRGTG